MKTPSSIAYYAAILSLLSSSVMAVGPAAPPGKAPVTDIEGFKWKNVFHPALSLHDTYKAACTAKKEFPATEYTLHDLFNPQPRGLLNWAESLKRLFTGREYPGDWYGKDPHQYNRHIVMMNYADVPIPVREWIETQEIDETDNKGLFLVYPQANSKSNRVNGPVTFEVGNIDREADKDRVVIFAPGAVYDTLPLWVAEGSDCEETLLDLSKYTAEPADGAVVAWTPSHTDPNMSGPTRDMTFVIKAEVLAAKPEEEIASSKAAAAEEPAAASEEAEAESVVEKEEEKPVAEEEAKEETAVEEETSTEEKTEVPDKDEL